MLAKSLKIANYELWIKVVPFKISNPDSVGVKLSILNKLKIFENFVVRYKLKLLTIPSAQAGKS